MKRSEMIDAIAEGLATDGVVSFSWPPEDQVRTASSYTEIAEFILDIVESKGMLPPFNKPFMDSSNGESTIEIKNYKWEPENE